MLLPTSQGHHEEVLNSTLYTGNPIVIIHLLIHWTNPSWVPAPSQTLCPVLRQSPPLMGVIANGKIPTIIQSVQFSHSVVSNSLQPHELQHARPPCPSPTPGVHPNPCPLSQWCRPTISSSVVPFSSCPQSFPASGSFPMSQLFASGGQWTSWISLQSKGLSRVFSNTTVQKHQFFGAQLSL